MSFERLAFQVWIEKELGCHSLTNWDSYKQKLEQLSLDSARLPIARSRLGLDAASLLHKALLTFASAYADLVRNQNAWGIVKLYYSLFYAIRARLCSRNHGLVRNRSWYHINTNSAGVTPRRLNGSASGRYRNDHEAALHLYEDLFSASDALLSNTISGETPFQWMMELRNEINYRVARFADPQLPESILPTPASARMLDEVISSNLQDAGHVLLFQPEHAWLGMPMKHLLAAAHEIAGKGHAVELEREQLVHTKQAFSILPNAFRAKFPIDKPFAERV